VEFKSLEFTPVERVRFRSVLEQVTPERALRDSIYPIGSLMIGNERRDHGAERKVWNI